MFYFCRLLLGSQVVKPGTSHLLDILMLVSHCWNHQSAAVGSLPVRLFVCLCGVTVSVCVCLLIANPFLGVFFWSPKKIGGATPVTPSRPRPLGPTGQVHTIQQAFPAVDKGGHRRGGQLPRQLHCSTCNRRRRFVPFFATREPQIGYPMCFFWA